MPERENAFPEPSPGDTATRDQVAAHWREQSPAARQEVMAAAEALRADPSGEQAARLLAALQRAGFDTAPRPEL